MALYKCNVGGGSNPILPDVLYYRDDLKNEHHPEKKGEHDFVDGTINCNFDCGKPIYTFYKDDVFVVPVGPDDLDIVGFYISSSTEINVFTINGSVTTLESPIMFNTVKYIDSINDYPGLSKILTFVDNGTNFTTYGFNIIGIWYISSNEFLMMYNWKTADNKLSATYSRAFKYTQSNNSFFMSNADTTFGVSLPTTSTSTVGSYYKGRIYKSDFNGNGAKLGIAYLRNHFLSTNIISTETLWHGYIASYVTTTASYISIAKSLASTLSVNVSQNNVQRGYSFGNSDGFFTYSRTSASVVTNRFYYSRNSATNVGGTASLIYDEKNVPDEISESLYISATYPQEEFAAPIILGKLNDEKYVIYLQDPISEKLKLSFYEILYASANNTAIFNKAGEIIIGDSFEDLELFCNDILCNYTQKTLYQILYNGDSYELQELGKITMEKSTKSTKYGATSSLLSYNPLGLYTDRLRGNVVKNNSNKYYDYENLSKTMAYLAATTVGNYALFGGGVNGANYLSTVNAYNTSLTRTIPMSLSVARYRLAATTVGNYALFGGGFSGTSTVYHSTVDAYDTSLTRTTPTELSVTRSYLSATTVGNYALFGGGLSSNYYSTVDAYDTSLTRTIPTVLSVTRSYLSATTVGNYALFGGGHSSGAGYTKTYHSTVDAYDASLTRTTPTELSAKRSDLAATTVGDYALFGGGSTNLYYSTVDAYDASLTRTIPTALSKSRNVLAATAVSDYALFGGGFDDFDSVSIVDAYDTSLTRTTPTVLNAKRKGLAATTVGNYALFGGGENNTLDVYTMRN